MCPAQARPGGPAGEEEGWALSPLVANTCLCERPLVMSDVFFWPKRHGFFLRAWLSCLSTLLTPLSEEPDDL